ncbi:MAG: glycosyltransferase family 2 protein [Cyclobacteriaceae bacterium]|nr:glycosyltransferase family 2 protein [Cyclobacteriaceae bacterium]
MQKVAVVILNYNGKTFLQQFLPGFLSCTEGHEIIVADNASTDGSADFIRTKFPNITLLPLPTNLGFAGGYNEALREIKSDYFAIVNSDIDVTPHWITPLVEFLNMHPAYAACQPKIKSFHQKTHFEYAGAAGGFIDSLGYPYCRGRIFDLVEADTGQYDLSTDVFWTCGACMLIRARVFWEAGGFDADFFAHMEEIDLSWRVQRLGYKLACLPQSTVYHVGGGTLSKTSPHKTFLNFRNGLTLLAKNLPLAHFWKIPFRMVMDWLAALKFVIENKPSHSWAILKAHAEFLYLLPKNLKKRKNFKAPLMPTKIRSIAWAHFVLGKRKYSELKHQ